MVTGSGFAVVGTLVSSYAKSVFTIIGGQTLTSFGNAMQLVCLAVVMEVVPAKHRIATTSAMSIINGALGVLGGVYVCKSNGMKRFLSMKKANELFPGVSACVEHGLGWKWGFHAQTIVSAGALIGVALFFHPPPPRVRNEQTVKQLAKSIYFIGMFLLALGSALIATALAWAGTTYPWDSSRVVSLLVIGPLVLVGFGIYEWKGRRDGVMHHDFFITRNFPIFLTYCFVDGLLIYATSVFIPNQLRDIYTDSPLDLANNLAALNSCLIIGFFVFGGLNAVLKKISPLLVLSSVLLTLFCGLVIKADASSRSYYDGMIAMVGLFTAGAETLPVGGMALCVPSHLIGTSNTVLASFRALGGVIGIAVFTALFNNNQMTYLPEHLLPILTKAFPLRHPR